MVRAARRERQWSPQDLAEAAGVSTATVSLVERARVGLTFATAERLLATVGLSLHVQTQPMWEAVDAALAGNAAKAWPERIEGWSIEFTSFVSWFAGTPYMADGLMAAALQGAPVPVTAFEIVVSEEEDHLDELTCLLDEMRDQRRPAALRDR